MKKIKIIFSLMFAIMLTTTILTFANNINVSANYKSDTFKSMTAKNIVLMHADSNTVLFAKNENEKVQVASISKLMTTLITLEKIEAGVISLDDMVIVSQHAASMEGSQAFLDAGSSYKLSDILKSVIVASANDSAVVLAETISGSEQEFTNLMNAKAKELKMNNTHYSNSTGLSAPNQYSSALDTAILLKTVGKYDIFNEDCSIWMDKLIHPSGRETELVNTNRLIKYYNHTLNGKTGFTDEAGYCLSSTAENKGLKLIAVTLNTSSASKRFKESMELFNYGFANYENKEILNKDNILQNTIKVNKGKLNNLPIKAEENFYAINKKGDKTEFELSFELKNSVNAPIKSGDVVGKCLIVKEGKVIGEVNIIASQDISKHSFKDVIGKVANNWKIKN